MTSTWLRGLTVGPVFVFGTALLVGGVGPWSATSLVVAAVLALPLLAAARPAWLGRLILPSIALFLLDGALTWAIPGFPTGGPADVIAGIFLGLPLWFLGILLGSPERPGIALLSLAAGLFSIVSTGSALSSIPALPTPTPEAFLRAWFTTDGHQLASLGGALAGGGLGSAPALPLAGYADPLFVALAFLALGGTLLPLLGTEDPHVRPPPTPSRRDLVPSVRRSVVPVLYATREPATPPRRASVGGRATVGGAVVAVAVFEAVAASAPAYAFLVVTLGVVATLLLLVRLQRPPRPEAAPGARPRPARAREL